jgi:ribose-phosphate pyrophosphokinase
MVFTDFEKSLIQARPQGFKAKNPMIILPGPASRTLSQAISRELPAALADISWKTFPDGETYIRINTDIAGEDVAIVQSTHPPQDTHLIQLMMILDAARELGARKVAAIAPYLGYMRQDRRFQPGECLTAKTVAKLIDSLRPDLLITVDIHSDTALTYFKTKTINVSPMAQIGKWLRSQSLTDPLIVSPDLGAIDRAREVASNIGYGDYDYLEKKRDTTTGTATTREKTLNAAGRDVVIIDDIISTGGTIANAARIAKKAGAKRVIAACTHPLLVGDSRRKMAEAGVDQVVGTDTVESDVSLISVAEPIAEVLRTAL